MTFGDPSSYTFLGTSRDVHVCDACGKTGLSRTFVVADDEGGTMNLGADCAGRALGMKGAPRALAMKLRNLEKRRGTKAAPKLRNREDVPRAIEGEIDGAVSRAVQAGAKPPVEFVGAGMTGIVLTDGKKVYKVARHDVKSTLAEEAEWLLDAAKVPFVKAHVAGHVKWDEERGVIVRDYVKGHPGRWSDEGKLFDLHKEIERHMLDVGWSAPEFKGDSYIMTERGPVLVDASMPSRVGKNLVGYVEDVLDGKREARESLSDLAFMLRREVIAKHNPKGTVEPRDMRRLLDRLEERGVDFDRSWKDV